MLVFPMKSKPNLTRFLLNICIRDFFIVFFFCYNICLDFDFFIGNFVDAFGESCGAVYENTNTSQNSPMENESC